MNLLKKKSWKKYSKKKKSNPNQKKEGFYSNGNARYAHFSTIQETILVRCVGAQPLPLKIRFSMRKLSLQMLIKLNKNFEKSR